MRHQLSSNKDPQADNVLSNYSVLLKGKQCYVRTVLRSSCFSVRHLSSDVIISATMMTVVYLELTPSRLLDSHPERCHLCNKLNGVTKQSKLSSNSALIPVTWPAVQEINGLSATLRSLGCSDFGYTTVVKK